MCIMSFIVMLWCVCFVYFYGTPRVLHCLTHSFPTQLCSDLAFARMSADPVSAQNAASASLARAASGQAFTLAFSDTLIVTAAIMLLGAIFVWALPALPPEPDSRPEERRVGKERVRTRRSRSSPYH